MPRFTTEEDDASPDDEQNPLAYMESGQMEWSWPGAGNPDRLKPAKWMLRNISAGDNWLGEVKLSGVPYGVQKTTQPTPVDTGVIRDNIESIAIGFRQTSDPAINAMRAVDNEFKTVGKKIVAGYFPTTHFSGKMRLFMQSQYGAEIPADGFPFYANIAGETITLHYLRQRSTSMADMQIGFWSHLSHGIFSAANYTYYLVKIEHGGSGTTAALTGYPIKLSKTGLKIRKALLTGKVGLGSELRAEAYMLSDAVIETDRGFSIGTYDPGTVGGGAGGSIAWGWKFNWSGSKASIVLCSIVGDEFANTLDGRAKDVHITISRSSIFDGSESGKWSITGTDGGERNWTDGWGKFNIFVPADQHSGELVAYSIKIGFNAVADYAYSDVAIYGFYNKDDEWVALSLTRHAANASAKWEQEQSNFVFDSNYIATYNYAAFETTGVGSWDSSLCFYLRTNRDASYEKRSISAGGITRMDVSLGSWSYSGEVKQGDYQYSSWSVSEGELILDDQISNITTSGKPAIGPGLDVPPADAYGAINTEVTNAGGYFGNWGSYSFDVYHKNDFWGAVVAKVTDVGSFADSSVWAAVISPTDCCAAHVVTEENKLRVPNSAQQWDFTSRGKGETRMKRIVGGFEQPEYTTALPWQYMWQLPFLGEAVPYSVSGRNVNETSNIGIRTSSLSLDAAPGTMTSDTYSLFNVEVGNPVYNGTISFRESAGNKYVGSEGYNSGGISSALFVGWF